MLWSFSWWTLILTIVPPGGLLNNAPSTAFVFMFLGASGPSLAGIILTRIVDGPEGLKALFSRLRQWRVGKWWLMLLIPYLINLTFIVVYRLAGNPVSLDGMMSLIPAGLGLGISAGLMEEFGWRGFLLPKLQQRYLALNATLLIGLVWGGIWHLYADYIALGNLGWFAIPIILLLGPVLLTAYAALLTLIYNRTQGSMLVCVLFHACISSSGLIFGVQYATVQAQLFWTAISVLIACLAVFGIIALAGGLSPRRATQLPEEMRLKPS